MTDGCVVDSISGLFSTLADLLFIACTVPTAVATSLSYRHSLASSSAHFMSQAVFV
jgi:hypothetical protein